MLNPILDPTKHLGIGSVDWVRHVLVNVLLEVGGNVGWVGQYELPKLIVSDFGHLIDFLKVVGVQKY